MSEFAIEKLGPNAFLVKIGWSRTPPRVDFSGLPEGTRPVVSDLSRNGFKVVFEPFDIPVHQFSFSVSVQ